MLLPGVTPALGRVIAHCAKQNQIGGHALPGLSLPGAGTDGGCLAHGVHLDGERVHNAVDQPDPRSVADGLSHDLRRDAVDAAPDYLLERHRPARCEGGENARLGHDVVCLHVVARIGLRVAPRLRVGERRRTAGT